MDYKLRAAAQREVEDDMYALTTKAPREARLATWHKLHCWWFGDGVPSCHSQPTKSAKCLHFSKLVDTSRTRITSGLLKANALRKDMRGPTSDGGSRRNARSLCCVVWLDRPDPNRLTYFKWLNSSAHSLDRWPALDRIIHLA